MKQRRTSQQTDYPIFYDSTGRRWAAVKALTLMVGVAALFFVMWMTPYLLNARYVPSLTPPSAQLTTADSYSSAAQLDALAIKETNNATPTIGVGSNVQLVKIVVDRSGCHMSDPLSGKKLRPLTQAEVMQIGNSRYAYYRSDDVRTLPPTVDQLMQGIATTNTAVIGAGPLVRVVEVAGDDGQRVIRDPFTRSIIGPMNDEDQRYVDGDRYALQRYGETKGKRIALTFDDGPNPVYTPQLLDMLSRESAHASFFVVGNGMAQYPEIAERLVREGHVIANHTFSHVDLDYATEFEAVQQINQTQRLIVAATNHDTPFFRPPYGGNTDQSLRNSMRAILQAQQLGYTVTSYDFDSNDWQFTNGHTPTYPDFDGQDKVVLVHDSGGDRSLTIAYVKEFIAKAKAHGYTFVSLSDMYPESQYYALSTGATFTDKVSLILAQAALVWPKHMVSVLFGFSVVMIALTTVLNVILAIAHTIKAKRKKWSGKFKPVVTVIVPAYNEGVVIVNSVRSLLQSRYRKLEVLIVDDGSTDDTWKIAQSLEKRYKRVKAIHQENTGKAAALNNAIAQATGDIVICVDADTIFPQQTVGNLVRHFEDETVGAVAGVIKVGNVRNILTRWQMLEYTVSIAIDRNAHAMLNSIMIIPGACGAWRKSAVLEAGGFSHSTLAEDCDLTFKIQRLNRYRIMQENDAISYTEAPEVINALTKQRFRWTFGNIQSLWKHRAMIFNRHYRWLGFFVMPNSLIGIIIPLFFWPLLAYISIQNVINGNYMIIVLYFVVSLSLQFIVAAIGLRLARERMSYLWAVPFARFIYGPLRLYILYNTVLTALRGSYVGWNKLFRTGTATYPAAPNQLAAVPIDINRNKILPTG